MGRPTSTPKYGTPLILFVLFALSSIAYGQGVTNRHGVSYQKHIDDEGNVIMYEVRHQLGEAVLTRSFEPVQENDELQKLLDKIADSPFTRAVSKVTDIDLSKYSTPRTETLFIRNGMNVRFVNGTLTRATSLTDAPLVQITGDSKLHLSETAEISGNNFYSKDAVLVEVLDGELDVEGGKIAGNSSAANGRGISVRLKSKDARFVMTAGFVENLGASTGETLASGGILDVVSLYNHINIMGDVKAYCHFMRKEAYLDCMNELRSNADITLSYYYPDQTVAINVPQNTLNCFKLSNSDNITGSKDDYQLSYEGNSLVVRKKNAVGPNFVCKDVEPGTLPDRIPDNARDIIEELTITGKLNGTDIVLLQDMAKRRLRKLDISGCDIVKGGSAYYTSSGSYAQKYYTADDEIGSSMFYQSTSLETVILPNSITKLYGSSFHYGSVKSITIGPKVSVIDGGLCPGTKLEAIVLNGNKYFVLDNGILYDAKRTTVYRAIVSVKGEIKFQNSVSVLENSAFDECRYITKVTLPSNLKEIKTACFSDCSSLTGVVFNASLSYLGYNCFSGCSALKTVDLSNTKVTYIYQSFYNCDAIETLLLPSTLQTIWGACFTSTKLNYISCPAVTPPTLEHPTSAFRYSLIKNSCRVVVPSKSMSAYKAATGWKEFLKYESDKDPNLITTEDELQHRLDEIAAEKPSMPVTLTIAEKGIEIGFVYASQGCKAKITGGSIRVRNDNNGADYAYAIHAGAEITFENITLDFGNKYQHYSTFLVNGWLTIGNNVTFQNIYQGAERTEGFFVTSGALLNIYSGEITARGSIVNSTSTSEVTIRGGILKSTSYYPTITGEAYVYHRGGSIIGGNKIVVSISGGIYVSDTAIISGEEGATLVEAKNSWYQGGTLKGSNTCCTDGGIGMPQAQPNMQVGTVYVKGKNVMYGHVSLPRLYMLNGSLIQLASAMTNTWIIDGDWSNFDLTEPYVIATGYDVMHKLTKEDYSRMQFANLPDDVEAVYNEEQQVVQLQKKETECDLQSLLDGLCEAGDEVPVPDEGVDIGCEDDPLQCAVDRTLDGGDNLDTDYIPLKVMCLCMTGPDLPTLRIHPYSSLTIRNYGIRSTKMENQNIEVGGTLVIDANVYIYNFLRFIHIKPGGRVIWRSGHVEDVNEIVYNEGGTLEIEGDFDNGGKPFVNHEGGALIIRKGTFKGDIENHGTLIIEGGSIEGRIDNYGELTMRDCTVEGGDIDLYNHDSGNAKVDTGCEIGEGGNGCIWSETDIWIKDNVRVTDIRIKRGCRIHVIGKLTCYWRVHFFVADEFDIYVPLIFGDNGYKLTEADSKYIEIILPEGYRWVYEDGKIVIVRLPHDIPTIVEYLEYFGPRGTPDNPWSFDYDKANIDVNADWHILKDYYLIFNVGKFTMNGGNIYVDSGATLWLKDITFKGTGHIYVSGTLYIDENVDFNDIAQFIHVRKGGVIRFAAQPSYSVPIYIGEEDVVISKAVITDVKEAWLKYFVIDLPEGYMFEYDDATHTILIRAKEVDGILEVTLDTAQQDIFDLYGRKVDKALKGRIYIRNGKKIVYAD